jgi:hypothetical protein
MPPKDVTFGQRSVGQEKKGGARDDQELVQPSGDDVSSSWTNQAGASFVRGDDTTITVAKMATTSITLS